MSHRLTLATTSMCAAGLLALAGDAGAVSIIKDPNPPKYSVEIEPHLNINAVNFDYGGFGWGPGVRFGIPVAGPAFVKTINDSIAISFGADLIHYDGYRYGCTRNGCGNFGDTPGLWALYIPVTMQWNFWLTDKWSAFGEPGLAVRHTFFSQAYNCDPNSFDCPSQTRLLAAFYVGARYHFGESTALTLRLGYPTGFSVGVSFF